MKFYVRFSRQRLRTCFPAYDAIYKHLSPPFESNDWPCCTHEPPLPSPPASSSASAACCPRELHSPIPARHRTGASIRPLLRPPPPAPASASRAPRRLVMQCPASASAVAWAVTSPRPDVRPMCSAVARETREAVSHLAESRARWGSRLPQPIEARVGQDAVPARRLAPRDGGDGGGGGGGESRGVVKVGWRGGGPLGQAWASAVWPGG